MSHVCGECSVDGFFEGKPARLRRLYDALVALVGELGPFEQVPTKTRVALDGLTCHLWLKRPVESPRFTKVELLGRNDWIHHFVLRSEETSTTSSEVGCARPTMSASRRISPGSSTVAT
jgi:hypothetical protein